jgi:hypothetical protein
VSFVNLICLPGNPILPPGNFSRTTSTATLSLRAAKVFIDNISTNIVTINPSFDGGSHYHNLLKHFRADGAGVPCPPRSANPVFCLTLPARTE